MTVKSIEVVTNQAIIRRDQPRQHLNLRLGKARFLLLSIVFFMLMLGGVGSIVVYQVRFISGKTGRTDYALTGESIELSCHYLMKDDLEDIKSVHWSKDGVNFIRWSKYKPGIQILDYTFKGHIDNSTTHSHLIIHNATIDMHGKYKCLIKTDLGQHEHEQQIVVISEGQCKHNVWRISSDQLQCRETFRLDCRQMFPRPVPSCGLWNERADKFIRSVAVDISEELAVATSQAMQPTASKSSNNNNNNRQTYRVRYTDKFELVHPANGTVNQAHMDLLHYAGHLVFKCDISVPDTSWRLSMSHKMFNYFDGCEQDPMEFIERKRAELNQYTQMRLAAPGMLELVNQHQSQQRNHHYRQLEGRESQASKMSFELLLPSQVRRLTHRNKYGGPGESQSSSRGVSHNAGAGSGAHTKRLSYTNEDLNCWQKPRVGTIVKLSCNGPAAGSNSLAYHHNSRAHSVKLTGTNLLECRSSGWHLVRETNAINNEILDTKAYKVLMGKRKKSAHVLPKTSTTANQDLIKDLQAEDNDESSTKATSSQDQATASTATLTPSTEKEEATIPQDAVTMAASPPAEEDELDEADDFVIDQQQQQPAPRQEPELTPEQLATLLPTCVSITQRRRQQRPGGGVPGLPLLEHGAVLSSSTHSNMAHQQQQDADWRWYFFMSSSGSPQHTTSMISDQGGHQLAFLLTLVSSSVMMLLQLASCRRWQELVAAA